MIQIQVCVTSCNNQVPESQVGYLRRHHNKQSVRSDVERQSQERICRTLVELEAQPAIGDIILEKAVTRWQCHLFDISRVPGGDDEPP